MENKKETKSEIKGIIRAYNELVKGIDLKASNQLGDENARAYGGVLRAGKGKLVESITRELIELAWSELGGDPKRLSFEKKTIKIPIKKEYIEEMENPDVKKFIKENLDKFHYNFRADVHVQIDEKLIIGIECKAYTENAMLKRILVDFTFLKQIFPSTKNVLIQLESQLGGDYFDIAKEITHGSYSTHTIMSYFDVDLIIITLLEGERKVDKAIHKKGYFKELKKENLEKAIKVFKEIMSDSI